MPKAILCRGLEVNVDKRVLKLGGSFNQRLDKGRIRAYDPGLLSWFLGRLEAMRTELGRGAAMFDIGAGTGSFTLLAVHVEVMRIDAFEPNPEVFCVLDENLELNDSDLSGFVHIHNVAIADKPGYTLKVPSGGKGHTGFATLARPRRFSEYKELKVPVQTLDAAASGLSHLDIIKSDINGCEYWMLQGGVKTFERLRPELVFEYGDISSRDVASFDDIVKLLKSWDYSKPKQVGREDWWVRPL